MGLRLRRGILAVGLGLGLVAAGADDPPSTGREIPKAFAPFEYLVGSWKGTGVPTANRVRGWPETHAWAWTFEKGVPVGMAVTMEGDKLLARAKLAFDPATETYTLKGDDPAGKPLAFSGKLDASGKTLTLNRQGVGDDKARQRFTLKPNANFVRYSLWVDDQEPGAPQFKRTTEVGVTKEGEAFAAGGAAADLPKCVVTGGAATMSVSYQGQTYPLCCSGCREEFNENPEKYLKKLAEKRADAGKTAAKPASAGKDDGAFDAIGDDPKAAEKASAPAKGTAETPKGKDPAAEPAKAADPAAKAASVLRLGQNLEKANKPQAALGYYRQVVKDYPGTAAAKTAAGRIKVLSK